MSNFRLVKRDYLAFQEVRVSKRIEKLEELQIQEQ